VPDVLREFKTFGIEAVVHDPHADPKEVAREYGMPVSPLKAFKNLDALVLAVPHKEYLGKPLTGMLRKGGILVDVKSVVDRKTVPGNLRYWSL
jgi:UDP-N-acetyl-D-galactosamine dehydrogenase